MKCVDTYRLELVGGDYTSVTKADQIFQLLSDAIIEGTIKPGSKISEPELSRQYQVSRASLREAIGRLEACNLVTRRANVGARVISLSSEQLLEIYHVREALEGMAARLAAEHMQPAEIEKLQQLVEGQRLAVTGDAGASKFQREGDLDFHYLIVKGSHNQRLFELVCKDLYHLVRMYRCQFKTASRRAPAAVAEHGYIVSAIADHDGEMAELLMRRHVRSSRNHLKSILTQSLQQESNPL